MNIKKLFAFLLIFWVGSPAFASIEVDNKVLGYFNELVFGAEFGGANKRSKKWVRDMKIFVEGEPSPMLDRELDKIIGEINGLIQPVQLRRVNSRRNANYIIFFGSGEDYTRIEPAAIKHIDRNWGLFWVYFNGRNEIYKGSMYVDTIRTRNKDAQKHLLREELTQSLGIMNDSYQYSDSIFYQKWSYVTRYSKIDKEVIRLLYQPEIRPNMTKEEINRLVNPTGPPAPAYVPPKGFGGGWRTR